MACIISRETVLCLYTQGSYLVCIQINLFFHCKIKLLKIWKSFNVISYVFIHLCVGFFFLKIWRFLIVNRYVFFLLSFVIFASLWWFTIFTFVIAIVDVQYNSNSYNLNDILQDIFFSVVFYICISTFLAVCDSQIHSNTLLLQERLRREVANIAKLCKLHMHK